MNLPSFGKSYICSQVFRLFGMQKPKSKSNVFNSWSRKKCLSIILKLLIGSCPIVNSTVAPTVRSLRNSGVKQYLTKRPPVSWPLFSSSSSLSDVLLSFGLLSSLDSVLSMKLYLNYVSFIVGGVEITIYIYI